MEHNPYSAILFQCSQEVLRIELKKIGLLCGLVGTAYYLQICFRFTLLFLSGWQIIKDW